MIKWLKRLWHRRLGFGYCEGDWYCDVCGKVQR